ncbi:MAG: HAMP domain-containing sensor histidine kinase [Elusimicrobia bacterium]|nr:HAMP domain-containing sensor histidine kinase [Elusimicrobiota bacterium]
MLTFKTTIIEKEIKQRIHWFIELRWIAVCMLFMVITCVRYFAKLELPYVYLYLGNGILLLSNMVFIAYNRHLNAEIDENKWYQKANIFANVQISLDLFILTYLLHFSGGIENPFIFYFIFHIIIAGILLTNLAAFSQATFAVVLLVVCAVGEYSGILNHYHLFGFLNQGLGTNPVYFTAIFVVFLSTMYITVYMVTSIVNKVREKEVALSEANEKIAEQDRLKSRYVATVSHDLQASLAAVQSCLTVVLEGLTGAVSEKSREMILRAERKTTHLINFVKELLDLSRIRAAKELEKNTFNIIELIQEIVGGFEDVVQEKHLKIAVDINDAISLAWANKDAIDKLLVNLVSNAIKYTPWGGTVGISLKNSTDNPGQLLFEIWDTGIGIPAEDKKKIFNEFYRSKNAEQFEKEGTGLGLSIVEEVIKAHRGAIWVDSEVGKGSRFIFTLPIVAALEGIQS